MGNFNDQDKELKELWGDFTTGGPGLKINEALRALSEPELPKGLLSKLKNIPDREGNIFSFAPGFASRFAVAASFAFIMAIGLIFFRGPATAPDYANLGVDEYVDDSFSAPDGDDEIFDDSLNYMEEIIWSA